MEGKLRNLFQVAHGRVFLYFLDTGAGVGGLGLYFPWNETRERERESDRFFPKLCTLQLSGLVADNCICRREIG